MGDNFLWNVEAGQGFGELALAYLSTNSGRDTRLVVALCNRIDNPLSNPLDVLLADTST
jgi:hypothetical protein